MDHESVLEMGRAKNDPQVTKLEQIRMHFNRSIQLAVPSRETWGTSPEAQAGLRAAEDMFRRG